MSYIVPDFLKLISGTPNKNTTTPTHHITLNTNEYTHLIDYQSQKKYPGWCVVKLSFDKTMKSWPAKV